ncbi:alkane 1-monooxygenase [Flavimaricola marinus]|uniref:Alkane 1-monooxygenase n=1 Tax=Flavimaricola marinus TaxID=1819565 RepID=A0A238LGL1_9RHOB|nr:alkane 1-monooxygenase [Flavimaricola marinus]SMY08683.1 Alkane 1-monooxygenase [Flavimaricola marinus]
MPRQMILFAIATLLPVPMIAAAAILGGGWVLLALAYLTLFTATLDEVVRRVVPATEGVEFPAAAGLSITLAGLHFALMALVVSVIALSDGLGSWEKAGLFAAAGLFFGQVSNSNAHELIHARDRLRHRLGMWVYISMLYGHHTSAHPLVHHVRVATRADPATSRRGESFYRYVGRAWRGGFRQGLAAETARIERARLPRWRHPYALYVGGALAIGLAVLWLTGLKGLLVWIGLAGYAQAQLLMSDYVQHYGLIRATDAKGKPVPTGPAHSWNSPHLWSSALMLNAPRHSDHHASPARPYPALRLDDDLPMLPRSLPVMSCLALHPRRWRKVMDPLADAWSGRT